MTDQAPEPEPAPLRASYPALAGTVGVWTFAQDGLAPPAAGEMAAEIESLGYRALWYPESFGREAFLGAQVLLAGTTTLVVASGIASIYARDPMTANAASRTLAAEYGDRFVLGLGVSHRPMVETMRGQEYTPPVATMRAYLEAMDRATFLADDAKSRPVRMIAALGPLMLRLAASACDGALPYLVTPEHTAFAREQLGGAPLLAVEQAVVLSEDREEYLRRAHAHLNIYTGLPNYCNNWRRLGFGDEDFVRGGSDRLADALVAYGDEATIRSRVQAHFDAGADHVCIQVLPAEPFVAPLEDWRRLAPAVTNP